MWIALVVPPAVLLLAVLLQRLEAAVLSVPDDPDPRDAARVARPEPTAADPAGGDPRRAPLALVPQAGPSPARPVCATHRRRVRPRRATA